MLEARPSAMPPPRPKAAAEGGARAFATPPFGDRNQGRAEVEWPLNVPERLCGERHVFRHVREA